MEKILVDFTGLIQFRGSTEVGGITWLGSLVMTFAMSLAASAVYQSTDDPDISVDQMWLFFGSLSGVWLACFAIFLLFIKHEYARHCRSLMFASLISHPLAPAGTGPPSGPSRPATTSSRSSS
jgi:hypothetical protein